jgi:hypothetical protein
VNETQEAQALARWLEEHPGQAPPPDVDPEVIEALYALRPDLAPPPNVRIEDIFAAVESGPFATAKDREDDVTEEVVSLAAERAKRVTHEAAPAPAVRKAPWWSSPGMGALAAAALALIVILPTAGILLTQKSANMEAAPPPPPATPAPAQEAGANAVAAPKVEAAPASQPDMHAEPPARRDANELLRQESDKKSDGMEEDRGRAAGGDFDVPADAAKPATVAPSADYRGTGQTEAVDDLEEQTVLQKTQPEAKMKAEEIAPAKELESYGAASAAAGAAGPSASSARSSERAKDAAAPAAPPMPAPAEAPAAFADESTSTPAAYGEISDASTDQALAAATDDSDDRKAMTAAWFLGRRQYDRGDHDAAMATIAKGLRRSGNPDLRADLTALQWTVAQSHPEASPAATDR